jgi:hypothetical protein
MTGPDDAAKAPHWRRWLWVGAVLLLGLQLWSDRTDAAFVIASLVVSILLFVALAFAARYIELQTQRPRKTYLRWALGAAVLGLALVAMPLAIGAGVVIGLMLWAGFVAAGFVWARYYEQSEPL